MKPLIRSALGAVAALLISVGPLSADCAGFISGWFMGGPSSGYLIGQAKVTLSASWDFYVGGSVSSTFCVGTYQVMLRDGSSYRIKLRCDTYEMWGLF